MAYQDKNGRWRGPNGRFIKAPAHHEVEPLPHEIGYRRPERGVANAPVEGLGVRHERASSGGSFLFAGLTAAAAARRGLSSRRKRKHEKQDYERDLAEKKREEELENERIAAERAYEKEEREREFQRQIEHERLKAIEEQQKHARSREEREALEREKLRELKHKSVSGKGFHIRRAGKRGGHMVHTEADLKKLGTFVHKASKVLHKRGHHLNQGAFEHLMHVYDKENPHHHRPHDLEVHTGSGVFIAHKNSRHHKRGGTITMSRFHEGYHADPHEQVFDNERFEATERYYEDEDDEFMQPEGSEEPHQPGGPSLAPPTAGAEEGVADHEPEEHVMEEPEIDSGKGVHGHSGGRIFRSSHGMGMHHRHRHHHQGGLIRH